MSLRKEILNRFEFLTYFLNPDAVEGPAVIQFKIEDARLDEPIHLYLQYDRQSCRIFQGNTPEWTTFITVQYEFWRELQGKRVGALRLVKELHLEKNIRVEGELREFLRFAKTFAGTLDSRHFIPQDVDTRHTPAGNGGKTPKRILVLSGSGRVKQNASSYHFASTFADGMSRAEQQPEVELIHLRDYNIHPCKGCFNCWRNGGTCVQRDDFATVVRPRLEVCNLLVLAYPLYFYDFPPQIRSVLTRMFVYDHPQLYWNEDIGDLAHHHREGYDFSLFLLSTGELFDRTQAEIPVAQAKLLQRRHGVPYLGCIYRQTGVGFIIPAARDAAYDEIEKALAQAGLELATDGRIQEKTLQMVEKDVVTPAQLRAGIRGYHQWLARQFKFPYEAPAVPASPFDVRSKSAKNK